MYYMTTSSPIGELLLTSESGALTGLRMPPFEVDPRWDHDEEPFCTVVDQLGSYFRGERKFFEVALDARGTQFQTRVWDVVREIPYGRTISYKELAQRVQSPSAFRAVGRAVGANPIPVIVPCHRVIGSNGAAVGFGGGLERKARLLELERA
jgi:methylated-DNA-[protein]-cysteine S-methyltransferase